MCLDIKLFSRKKIATEDIQVFKVIKAYAYNEGETGGKTWRTPYRDCPVEFGKAIESKLGRRFTEVNAGVHSYTTFKGAYSARSTMSSYDLFGVEFGLKPTLLEYRVVKAIIPKGAEYYLGTHQYLYGFETGSYASNQLIILNENA